MQHIGKQIKDIRIKKNLKQQAVADAIGMSLTAYSNIECGKTENITLQRLRQIAEVLKTDMAALLNDYNNPDDPFILSLQNELHHTKKELHEANEQIEVLRGKNL